MARSASPRTTFKGGILVSEHEQRSADLLIEDELVAGVGDLDASGAIVHASGLLVLGRVGGGIVCVGGAAKIAADAHVNHESMDPVVARR